jgi:hypothetical protein
MDIGDKRDTKSMLQEAEDEKRVEETKKKFLIALALESVGGMAILACQVSGIARSYIYRLRSADPKFREEWDEAVHHSNELLGDIAEMKLMELVKMGNVSSIIFALKKYRPEKFGDRRTHEEPEENRHELSPEYQEMLKRFLNKNDTN